MLINHNMLDEEHPSVGWLRVYARVSYICIQGGAVISASKINLPKILLVGSLEIQLHLQVNGIMVLCI